MQVYLLSTGKAVLEAQRAEPSFKLTLSSFALAEQSNFEYIPEMQSPVGHVFYTGSVADMAWARLSDNQMLISMKVGYNKPYGIIGNAMLFVSFKGVVYPFVLLRLDDASRFNHHLNDGVNEAGMDLYLRVMINLTNVFDRFNLSGVTQEICEWLHYTNGEVPDAASIESDQIVIENHPATGGRPVLATNVTNEWWGMPFENTMDNITSDLLSGGVAGDGFVYEP